MKRKHLVLIALPLIAQVSPHHQPRGHLRVWMIDRATGQKILLNP